MRTIAIVLALATAALACTNFLVTKGASTDGSTMITYNADSHVLYGALYYYPHAFHERGAMKQIYDWDTGAYLGQIPEANETYNVIGNMNEFQVAIGETTYGGLTFLQTQKDAIMDYGSLIWTTLQRSKTAKEAISMMAWLMDTYGYFSEGESFSISDPNEAWIMEVIGKGDGYKGAVWVAVRIPDGAISGHANQARIQQFARGDPANCVYSPDVVQFARDKGLYNGTDADFSFSDVYDPVTFMGARGCDGRVWSFFRAHADGMDDYVDYVSGRNLTHRMPLYVYPTHKVSLNDTMNAMRDHYENSWLAFSEDVGAGPFRMPYRWRPLDWDYNGKKYTNERSTSTQQTGFSFVAQSRSWINNTLGGIIWFAVDDPATSIYYPQFTAATRIPFAYAKHNGDMMTFTFKSAFWVFNMIGNWAYSRWDLIAPEVQANIYKYEARYMQEVAAVDHQVKAGLMQLGSMDDAIELVTRFSETTGDELVHDMLKYWQYLFVKYMDGNMKFPSGKQNPIVKTPGYTNEQHARIVNETGDHYLEPANALKDNRFQTVDKSLLI